MRHRCRILLMASHSTSKLLEDPDLQRYLCVFRSDATCIICGEEMTIAKKLLCGRLFHVHCLRSWLERQHTCPTCRAPITPLDNGHAASARQHGAQPGVPFAAGIGTPGSEGAASENVNRRQAKLEAAALAASLYGRSFAYPPTNSLNRYLGTQHAISSTSQSGEASASNQSQADRQNTASQPVISHGPVSSTASNTDLEKSLQVAYENAIRSQIETEHLGLVVVLLMLLKRRVTRQWLHLGERRDYFLDVIF